MKTKIKKNANLKVQKKIRRREEKQIETRYWERMKKKSKRGKGD